MNKEQAWEATDSTTWGSPQRGQGTRSQIAGRVSVSTAKEHH